MSNTIQLSETLHSFFYAQLTDAQHGDSQLSDELGAYLVHMLADHALETEVAGRGSAPFALQFLEARQAAEGSIIALKRLGDRALYVAGVLPHSYDLSITSIHYVAGIGRAAYQQIDAKIHHASIFTELAERFETLADLISKAMDSATHPDEDLLAIYSRWQQEKHPDDARKLIAAGVRLDPRASAVLQ